MIHIPGFKQIKNKKGEITHARLSIKHFSALIDDIISHAEMVKARKGNTIDWTIARKKLNKKFRLKS